MNRISNLYKTLYWIGDANGQLHLLDQTRLPLHLEHTICRTAEEVWQAIKVLKVRGTAIAGVGSVWCGDRSAGVSSRCGQCFPPGSRTRGDVFSNPSANSD